MKLLITGGTVFVSRYAAEYFAYKGHDVFVLNRNTRKQAAGVTLIQADRHQLQEILKPHRFDAVLDVTAYNDSDVNDLLDGLGAFERYILVSSSAVYPEDERQPFQEQSRTGPNRYWGSYGTDKIKAEEALTARVEDAYIIRPPYLYGPYNNVYREAFVFACAEENRTFCMPPHDELPLQFFHVRDLCRMMEAMLEGRCEPGIYNAGNPETITVKDWVRLCYVTAGKELAYVKARADIPVRSYFSFYDYAYQLDVTKQQRILKDLTPLSEGLKEACEWWLTGKEEVKRKPFLDFIDAEGLVEKAEIGSCNPASSL
ncbi:MAG: NAD-dependent epimerase/dehydratase family protein [Solobacterium sp.]|nr:NAD-dependent epimerase/dehydratase family protein [Solobacterium sp.]